MKFTKPVVTIEEREVVSTDRYEQWMASRVQTVKKITISLKTEVSLSCRLTFHNYAPEELIESSGDKFVLANSIDRPGEKEPVIVQCMNPTSQPLELHAGITISMFTSIDQTDASERREQASRGCKIHPRDLGDSRAPGSYV